jgi:outer membrane protein OmpA-like peptidoglycan-associated protein/ABC-type nitrate/sulfonate/bicarbonate transport system substrate-binding protein
MRIRCLWVLALAGLFVGDDGAAPPAETLSERVDTSVRACDGGETLRVPLRSSGVDLVPLYANDYALETGGDGAFAERDLSVELFRENDLAAQLDAYLACESPVLRATQGQLQAAAELTADDERTQMVAFYQHGWSTGADALVARERIDTLADLSGATIALEAYGPQMDLLARAIAAAKDKVDAGAWQAPELVYTADQTGFSGDTPGARFYDEQSVDAALVFRPDANVLTSGGETGTGAEGSVEGAHILFSTQAANRAISEVYAVRSDYLEANRERVKRFVSALFRAEEQVREDVKKQIIEWPAVAEHLLGDDSATRAAKTVWRRVETAGMQGNVNWSSSDHPRAFAPINAELANALVPLGLLASERSIRLAGYDYPALAEGVFDKRRVELPSFDRDEATKMVDEERSQGDLDERTIARFEIQFEPNQSSFPLADYRKEFDRIVEAASTYGGAVFTVEGHADPLGYLKKKKKGADLSTLRSIRQSAKNLSRSRAVAVRKSVIDYAESQGVSMDPSQFVTEGLGFSDPKTGICGGDPCPPKTKEQWLSNMRVVFRAVRVEAESSTFTPPNSW